MTGGFPHVHLNANAGAEPDPAPRAYRITVLLQRVTEDEGFEVACAFADALAARGIAMREEDETVRSVLALDRHEWPQSLGAGLAGDLAGALHVLVPKSVPQTPDLAQDYSPN